MTRLLGAAAILLLAGGMATAEEMAVPVDTQVPLFLKILTFDRNLPSRAGDDVTIAIVYQRGFRDSLLVREAFVAAIASHPLTVGHLPTSAPGTPRWRTSIVSRSTGSRSTSRSSGTSRPTAAPPRSLPR